MSSESKVVTAHFNVNIRVNDYESRWSDPSAERYFSFSIPVELFESGKVAKMIEGKVKEIVVAFEEEVKEAERKAQEEANG